MSAKITPGQNARAIRNTRSADGVEVVKNAQVTVEALPDVPFPTFVARLQGQTGLIFDLADFEAVEPTEPYNATPAPLDPSKVKAGDTVTLSADETSTRGPVKDIQYAGGGEWDVWIANHAQPFRTGRIGLWAVTAHQPVPKPELEWGPGTVAALTVWTEDDSIFGQEDPSVPVSVRGVWNGEEWQTLPDEHHKGQIDVLVTDVRPLVVIDPAAARKALEDNGWGEHETNEILHHLGIEVAR